MGAIPLTFRSPAEFVEQSDLLIDQSRTISNKRFMGERPVATLSGNYMKRLTQALRMLTGQASV